MYTIAKGTVNLINLSYSFVKLINKDSIGLIKCLEKLGSDYTTFPFVKCSKGALGRRNLSI